MKRIEETRIDEVVQIKLRSAQSSIHCSNYTIPITSFVNCVELKKKSFSTGALNTVGRFLVNMTRGQEPTIQHNNNPSESVPDAILTLSKTVLGQNVTKTIEPLIKGTVVIDDNRFDDGENKKTRKKIVKKDVEKLQQSKPKVDIDDVAKVEATTSPLSVVTSVRPGKKMKFN